MGVFGIGNWLRYKRYFVKSGIICASCTALGWVKIFDFVKISVRRGPVTLISSILRRMPYISLVLLLVRCGWAYFRYLDKHQYSVRKLGCIIYLFVRYFALLHLTATPLQTGNMSNEHLLSPGFIFYRGYQLSSFCFHGDPQAGFFKELGRKIVYPFATFWKNALPAQVIADHENYQGQWGDRPPLVSAFCRS